MATSDHHAAMHELKLLFDIHNSTLVQAMFYTIKLDIFMHSRRKNMQSP